MIRAPSWLGRSGLAGWSVVLRRWELRCLKTIRIAANVEEDIRGRGVGRMMVSDTRQEQLCTEELVWLILKKNLSAKCRGFKDS